MRVFLVLVLLVCGCAPDKVTDFLLPFEGIMRSFKIS